MELITTQEELKAALDTVKRGASNKSTLPALSCVMVEADSTARLTTTNLDLYAKKRLTAKVVEKGSSLVPVSTLSEFVSTLPTGQVTLKSKKGSITVTCGKFQANIKCYDAEEFPTVPSIEETSVEFDAEVLKGVINRTVYAAATDDSRPVLISMLMQGGDKFTACCADGFRLSVVTLSIQTTPFSLLIPAKSMKEITKMTGTVRMGTNGKQVVFRTDDFEIGSRLIEGQYPPIDRIMPDGSGTQITVSVSALLGAIKNVAVFARDNSQIARFHAEGDTLEVSASSAETGDTKVAMDASCSESIDFALNVRYISEALSALGSEQALLSVKSASSPILIRPVGDGSAQNVLMPMHTNR